MATVSGGHRGSPPDPLLPETLYSSQPPPPPPLISTTSSATASLHLVVTFTSLFLLYMCCAITNTDYIKAVITRSAMGGVK